MDWQEKKYYKTIGGAVAYIAAAVPKSIPLAWGHYKYVGFGKNEQGLWINLWWDNEGIGNHDSCWNLSNIEVDEPNFEDVRIVKLREILEEMYHSGDCATHKDDEFICNCGLNKARIIASRTGI